MTRQLRRKWTRLAEKTLLGGVPRSKFDDEVLATVDATVDLWYRLSLRGWASIDDEPGLDYLWEWRHNEVPDDVADNFDAEDCATIMGDEHGRPEVSVQIPGAGDSAAEYQVPLRELTDERLDSLQAVEYGDPAPQWLTRFIA